MRMKVERSTVPGMSAAISSVAIGGFKHLTTDEVVALRAILEPFEVEPKTAWTVEYRHEDGWGPSTKIPAAYASLDDAKEAIQEPWLYRAVLAPADGSYRVEFRSLEGTHWMGSDCHYSRQKETFTFQEACDIVIARTASSNTKYRIVPA